MGFGGRKRADCSNVGFMLSEKDVIILSLSLLPAVMV